MQVVQTRPIRYFQAAPAAPGSSTREVAATAQTANLQKRARSKFFSLALAKELADLNSPLKNAYVRTMCCTDIITQTGNKLISTYCGARWCITCSRIRTAKMINKYEPHLVGMYEPHFITLTVPNITGEVKTINSSIKEIQQFLRKTFDRLRKDGIKYRGFRKIEITYNETAGSFHPHIHILTDGSINKKNDDSKAIQLIYKIWKRRKYSESKFWQLVEQYNSGKIDSGYFKAEILLQAWLENFTSARRVAQDIRPATPGTLKELFKYSTKILSKSKSNGREQWTLTKYTSSDGEAREVYKKRIQTAGLAIYVSALDKIYQAIYRKRIIQPIGYTKQEQKTFNELLEGNINSDLESEIIEDLAPAASAWQWYKKDWHNIDTGIKLTGWQPDKLDRERVSAFIFDSG